MQIPFMSFFTHQIRKKDTMPI